MGVGVGQGVCVRVGASVCYLWHENTYTNTRTHTHPKAGEDERIRLDHTHERANEQRGRLDEKREDEVVDDRVLQSRKQVQLLWI